MSSPVSLLSTVPFAGMAGIGPNSGGGGGSTGTLGAATPWNYNPSFGGVPGVPSPGATQSTALGSNLDSLGQLEELVKGLDTATAAGAAIPYNLNLPSYGPMTATASGDIMSELQGQVPQDVVNQLARTSAERGTRMGMGVDSPSTNAALMSALGTDSLKQIAKGQADLTSAVGRTPTGPQFNPATMLLDPNQQQEWQYLANLLASAPNPTAAAQTNLQSLLSAVRGGAGATGGGPTTANPFPGAPQNTRDMSWFYQHPNGQGPSGAPAPGWVDPGQTTPYTDGTGTSGNLPGGDQGASAYQQAYGSDLPPGSGYDPVNDQVYSVGDNTNFYADNSGDTSWEDSWY